ncbi:hypothetical protein MLD38_021739 [Melastoma candidum]|uniref:Uncharacterized protein n=1 Tax=Melastoma candidum TaxID=119954 RepID=A0ACB9QHJ3_9MYRT|nr:hypothetical protein MLD38_021739 [Melastoma candidum]
MTRDCEVVNQHYVTYLKSINYPECRHSVDLRNVGYESSIILQVFSAGIRNSFPATATLKYTDGAEARSLLCEHKSAAAELESCFP